MDIFTKEKSLLVRCKTLKDIVSAINNNPKLADKIATQYAIDSVKELTIRIKDTTIDTFFVHLDTLTLQGAKIDSGKCAIDAYSRYCDLYMLRHHPVINYVPLDN